MSDENAHGSSSTIFRVVIEGGILPRFNHDVVLQRLARLLSTTEHVAAQLLSDRPHAVKSGVDHSMAIRYLNALRAIGVQCHLERQQFNAQHIDTTPVAGVDQSQDGPQGNLLDASGASHPQRKFAKYCAKCKSAIRASAEICPKCGMRQALS